MAELGMRGFGQPRESQDLEVDFDVPVEQNDLHLDLGQQDPPAEIVADPPVEEKQGLPAEVLTDKPLDDDSVLKHLNSKLGKEFKSFDELTKKEVVEVNPFEEDSYLKNFADWRKKTGRTAEDWVKYQKDFKEVPDLEIARELLRLEYPTLTADEVELELTQKFIPNELDTEQDEAFKKLELKKFAVTGRTKLEEMKQDLGNPLFQDLSPEVKEDLQLAKEVKESLANRDVELQEYQENIKKQSELVNSFQLQLSDDLAIDFNLSEVDKKELPDLISNMPHWRNEDGSWNHKAVVEDAIKIKYLDKMVKIAFDQGVASGIEKSSKGESNITLDHTTHSSANLNDKPDFEIEGFNNFTGNRGTKIRFGKKK